MNARAVACLHPNAEVVPLGRFEHHDLDALRVCLRGGSVVDWFRLHLNSVDEIKAFLGLFELDPDDRQDAARLEALKRRAQAYLSETLRYRIPPAVEAADFFGLVNYASGRGRRSHRMHSCITLKVMHILHYIDAHELLARLPISNAEVGVLLRAKVERVVRGLLERGFPIVNFSGNTKTRASMISKLLAKKETQSAQVFDKLRFRFVTERPEDVPSLLVALQHELIPFNYSVPDQSENSLLDLEEMVVRAGNLRLAMRNPGEEDRFNEAYGGCRVQHRKNEFSGPSYRVVHFISEIPVRVDRALPFSAAASLEELGPVVFGSVEFQLLDRRSAIGNERGENRHASYKNRQRLRVKERLERGKREKRERISSRPQPAD